MNPFKQFSTFILFVFLILSPRKTSRLLIRSM